MTPHSGEPVIDDAECRAHAARIFHLYRSTTCKHRLHVVQRCRRRCKWCFAPCWCRCHGRWGRVRGVVRAAVVAWGGARR